MHIDFDWDPAKASSNFGKHGVAFEEAMTVFGDPFARSILDPDGGAGEERWITLGQTTTGNLLVADINPDRSAVRIISARRPTRNEARQYREDQVP